MKKRQYICLILLILSSTASLSQLDLDKIMSGNQFIGHQPENIVWSPNSQFIYFRWKHENESAAPYYVYSLAEKKYRKLSPEETLMLPVDGFTADPKNSITLFSKGDRLFEWTSKSTKNIYSKYSPFYVHSILDANRILLREGDNLFLFNKAEPSIRQITFFQKGNEPDNKSEDSFLITQQEELFEIVRADKKRKQDRANFYDAHSFKELSPVYLEGKYLSFISINTQLTHVVFGLDKYPEDTPTHIEEYVNASGYSRSVNARPKVGSEDPQHELYCWNLKDDTCFQIQFDHLTDVKKRPEFLKEYEKENFKATSEKAKKMVFLDHGFNDAGDKYLLEIKSYDNKDRWIVCYDTLTKKSIEIEHQHDEKWIGGPGISGWKMEAGNVGWINNNKVYFQSEESGYSHLFTADLSEKTKIKKENITSGEFEIHQALLSKDKTKFFITANKNHPGNREFYSLEIATKKLSPINF
jgi:hypothetical protein